MVWQYQFYKSTQYTLQRTIQTTRAKELKYSKKALEVLSEMENANVLCCLLAHMDVLSMALTPKPDTHFAYSGSKNCPNVWLFWKDCRTNQENLLIIYK